MQAVSPYKDAVEVVLEEGGDPLKTCFQCGLCSGTCPWNLVRSFIVRQFIHETQLGLVDLEDEDIWTCVGCRACVQVCPRGVEIPDIMRALRRVIVEVGAGKVPDSLRLTMKNVGGVGNPLGEPQENRMDWAKDLDVKTYTKGMEILYFPCCFNAYDPRIKKVALATVNILKRAGVEFGIPEANVVCCGESMRKAGTESMFHSLAQTNISAFSELGAQKILVTSPHCYHTFRDEYPEFGARFEVVHLSQYLLQLLNEGRLKLEKEVNKRVTYHDSCCLGRYSGIYDEPREVLGKIPGLELVEMIDNREHALCCGGCSGRLWMETRKGERFSDLRVEQATNVEADTLAVACPYCMLNFEDSVLTTGISESILIKDIAELVEEAL